MTEMNPHNMQVKVASNEKNIPSVVVHILCKIGASERKPINAIIWSAIIIVVIIITSIKRGLIGQSPNPLGKDYIRAYQNQSDSVPDYINHFPILFDS